MSVGFANDQRNQGAGAGCAHHDPRYEEMGGVAFRFCAACGATHALWQFADRTFGLIAVQEYGPETWERVAREQGPKKRTRKPKEPKPPRIVSRMDAVVIKAGQDGEGANEPSL